MPGEGNQRVDNSRRFRDDVPYVLPKDLGEDERLDLQHSIFRFALKGNYVAPLSEDLNRILDVGSGSGIWSREIALRFPSANVFGLDLEPPHIPSSSEAVLASPPNYRFVQGNILQGLPFSDDTFDFTHQRMLSGAIPTQSWPQVVQELARVTCPEGWIELLEASNIVLHAGPTTELLLKWVQDLCLSHGIDMSKTEELGMLLTQAGLTQVVQRSIDIPIGAWDTQVGLLLEQNFLTAYQALKPAICKLFLVDPAAFDAVLDAIPVEWEEYHTAHRFFLVYGQKDH